ncbi:hypothetical protein LIER_08149 [Lithospermum erythrorhizon]|uniref:Uncharacterized protein n=1 Tax=Lithospermum erythrorhizon TaxID=34254 RepID=A0AAV3PAY1_LITER
MSKCTIDGGKLLELAGPELSLPDWSWWKLVYGFPPCSLEVLSLLEEEPPPPGAAVGVEWRVAKVAAGREWSFTGATG